MLKFIKIKWFFILGLLSTIIFYVFRYFGINRNIKIKSYYEDFKQNQDTLEKKAEIEIKTIEEEANLKINKIESVKKIKDKHTRLKKRKRSQHSKAAAKKFIFY